MLRRPDTLKGVFTRSESLNNLSLIILIIGCLITRSSFWFLGLIMIGLSAWVLARANQYRQTVVSALIMMENQMMRPRGVDAVEFHDKVQRIRKEVIKEMKEEKKKQEGQ